MARRLSFSGVNLELPEIAANHRDLEISLFQYFSPHSPTYNVRFALYTTSKVTEELHERLAEADLSSCFTVMSAVEATFRIDYLQRCYRREKRPAFPRFS